MKPNRAGKGVLFNQHVEGPRSGCARMCSPPAPNQVLCAGSVSAFVSSAFQKGHLAGVSPTPTSIQSDHMIPL